jgi:hypothetical protein
LEYRVATPLLGPWYWWDYSDLGVSSYYNPRTYPRPAENPFIPKRSGSFIQPGNLDPLAYELAAQKGLDGLDQETLKGLLVWAVIGAAAGNFLFGKKTGLALGAVLGVVSKYVYGIFKQQKLGQIDFAPEDPTGGSWSESTDIWPDYFGSGESVAVASQYFGTLKPRGFAAAATTVP